MKIFKDWDGDKTASFIMFLAKEARKQQTKLRNINKYFTVQAEVNFVHMFHAQQGMAAEANTIFMIAKDHFGFTERKKNKL